MFGSVNGIYLDVGANGSGNLVYNVTGSGIYYGYNAPAAVTGNTVYGAGLGISGGEYQTGGIIPISGT